MSAPEFSGETLLEDRIVADEVLQPMLDVGAVERGALDVDQVLDVDPVVRPIEQRLADRQVLGRDDRDLGATEVDGPGAGGHGLVEGGVHEEEVHVRRSPQHACLVARGDLVQSLVAVLDREQLLQGSNDLRSAIRRGEDVDVDVQFRGISVA